MQEGDVIAGRFELVRPLGSGGHSVVWRARDRNGQWAAVKIVEQAPEGAIRRFAREARVLASLRHPGIVRHIAHGSIGIGTVFLAMELLEGESLEIRLEEGPLSLQETLELGSRVAHALALAHGRGIVHRDVKPSNLFLVEGRVRDVKLLDFGVARIVDISSLRVPGHPLGTPAYMAPEQARDHAAHDARADLFTLGCVLFECLAGRPAFVADNLMAVLAKILFEPAPRLSSYCPDAPRRLERLIARMLSKKPEERPESGTAVADALDELMAERQRLSSAPPVMPDLWPSLDGRRLLSVVLVVDPTQEGPISSRTPNELGIWRTMVADIAARADARSELLAEGSPVVIVPGVGDPDAHALRAAELALEIRTALESVVIAVSTVTGIEDSDATLLVGRAIDAATDIMERGAREPGAVYLDDPTARLLEGQLEMSSTAGGHQLQVPEEN